MAQSFEAYYDLQVQLALGELGRQYRALAHGRASARLVDTRQVASKGCCRAGGRGKPSRTRLEIVEHFSHLAAALSHVCLEIFTGRKHQIRLGWRRKSKVEAVSRSQLAHLGHPLVRDGLCPSNRRPVKIGNRYSSTMTFEADLDLSARHRSPSHVVFQPETDGWHWIL